MRGGAVTDKAEHSMRKARTAYMRARLKAIYRRWLLEGRPLREVDKP